MSDEFTLTFVCVSCGLEVTRSYASARSRQSAKSKAKYCPSCAHKRRLQHQKEVDKKAREYMQAYRESMKSLQKPKPKYAPELDEQKDLKEINQKCNAYLAKHSDLQKPGAFYIPKADRAPEEVMQYGDAAADRYKRLMEKKTKKGEMT